MEKHPDDPDDPLVEPWIITRYNSRGSIRIGIRSLVFVNCRRVSLYILLSRSTDNLFNSGPERLLGVITCRAALVEGGKYYRIRKHSSNTASRLITKYFSDHLINRHELFAPTDSLEG